MNQIREFKFDQEVERHPNLYGYRDHRGQVSTTIELTIDVDEPTAEKLIAAMRGNLKPGGHVQLNRPEILAIFVSQLKP